MAKSNGTKKSRRFSIPRSLGVLVVTILFLLVPIVSYFTFYISNQTTYFTNRNFRQLADISTQLEERIELFQDIFSRAVKETVNEQGPSGAKRTLVNLSPSKPAPVDQSSKRSGLQDHLPPLFVVTADPDVSGPDWQTAKKNLDRLKASMQITTGGETSWIEFRWDILPEHKPDPITARAKFRLDDAVSPLLEKRNLENAKGSEHKAGFDSLLIASLEETSNNSPQAASETRLSSKTIFQQGVPELDIDSLDHLLRADLADKTVDFNVLSRNTGSADVRLADTNYKIYVQPIELSITTVSNGLGSNSKVNPENRESRWVVCGLVEASHFRHETWAFPYTMLITFAFATVLVALSYPFLKLWSIGPKDRLRLADVYVIAFALLVGSAILTFFILFGLTYAKSERELDQRLNELSSEMTNRFHQEVSDIVDQLDRLKQIDDVKLALQRIDNDPKAIPGSQPTLYYWPDIFQPTDKGKPPPEQYLYPYFHTVVWMDRDGERRFQWTVTPGPNDRGFKFRDYFRKIVEGDSRGCLHFDPQKVTRCTQDSVTEQFWLEPVTSRLTAEKAVIASRALGKGQTRGKADVVVMDVAMASLMGTVLPSGFGYRIIDNSGRDPADDDADNPGKPGDPGRVLFQSSESQQLRENFFQECDNNHSLRSLVFGRGSDFVDVNYRGEAHRLFVTPIDGYPDWSLIVFRDKQPLRTVYLEMLTLAGFIFFIYATILLIVFTIIYLVKTLTEDRTEWIWPSQRMSEVYKQTLYANLLLCVLSIMFIVLFDRWLALVLSGIVGFVGIFILALRLRLRRVLNKLHQTVNSLRINKLFDRGDAYIWNVVALVILAGVLPAVAFFKVAYNEEMKLFVKHGQLTLAQGLEQRYLRIRTEYSTEREADKDPSPFGNSMDEAKAFIKTRSAVKQPDVYQHFFYGTSIDQHPTESPLDPDPDFLLVSFNKYVPLFNETSIELGALTRNQADDKSWQWEQSKDGSQLILHPDLPGVQGPHIATQFQRFGPKGWFALLWAFGFAAIFGILWGLTQFVVRKIFLLDVNYNVCMPVPLKNKSEIASNVFLIHNSSLTVPGGFSPAGEHHRIDLATETLETDWLAKIQSKIKKETLPRTIVIDHFGHELKDSVINSQKLSLVEYLLRADKVVLIISSDEPAAYSFDGVGANGSKTQGNQANERWNELLSRFRKLYAAENDDMIKVAATNLQASLGSMSEQRRAKTVEMAELVKSECSSSYLQNIGKGIIEQLAFEEMEAHQIMEQIYDQAESYYRKIWNACSEGEKLTLLHLAEDRLLSPKDPDIESLLKKGLIVFLPDVRLMNATFKRFVLSQSLTSDLQTAETQAKKGSYWEAFKIPLFISFIGVVVFLLVTQKQLYSSSWTLITGATTAIPAFFKLLSLVQGESTEPKVYNA